ncbi:MAG TPA: hypothetical protein VNS52_19525 [Gemmatimonadaceae bacterium]|nr:hypothetical protein [Gemmatimonadaceae bacterium]
MARAQDTAFISAAKRAGIRLPIAQPLDITDDTILDWYPARVAPAAGMPRLRDISRRAGDPELRLYVGGGLGQPEDMYVLRRHHGHVTGALWLWWRSPPNVAKRDGDPDTQKFWQNLVREMEARWVAHAAANGCPHAEWRVVDSAGHVATDSASVTRGLPVLVCRATFTREPDWAALSHTLDSLGVWTMPDETELPGYRGPVSDAGTLWVEAFDGRRYRAYSNGGLIHGNSPQAGRATAMMDALNAIRRDVKHQAPAPGR